MRKSFYIPLIILFFFYACNKKSVPQIVIVSPPVDTISTMPVIDSAAINLAVKIKYLQDKFPGLLDESPDSLSIRLYSFIDEWLNTPFKWGGMDKSGIDCSAFVQRLFFDVYELEIPRTCIQQLKSDRVERFKPAKFLSEGDIIFFKTMKDKVVSHVGFYLRNDRFVNASSKNGVSICTLNDDYWKRHYVLAARVKVFAAKKSLNSNISMK